MRQSVIKNEAEPTFWLRFLHIIYVLVHLQFHISHLFCYKGVALSLFPTTTPWKGQQLGLAAPFGKKAICIMHLDVFIYQSSPREAEIPSPSRQRVKSKFQLTLSFIAAIIAIASSSLVSLLFHSYPATRTSRVGLNRLTVSAKESLNPLPPLLQPLGVCKNSRESVRERKRETSHLMWKLLFLLLPLPQLDRFLILF